MSMFHVFNSFNFSMSLYYFFTALYHQVRFLCMLYSLRIKWLWSDWFLHSFNPLPRRTQEIQRISCYPAANQKEILTQRLTAKKQQTPDIKSLIKERPSANGWLWKWGDAMILALVATDKLCRPITVQWKQNKWKCSLTENKNVF